MATPPVVGAASTLWASIAAHCRGPAEASFVRSEIGDDRVSRNDVVANELECLRDILNDVRGSSASRPMRSFGAPLALARQLALQERLQIMLLGMSSNSGSVFTAREKMVAEFIANGRQRPTSASFGGRTSRPGSSIASSRPSSSTSGRPLSARGDLATEASADVQHLADSGRLQHHRVHEVARELQELFDAEHKALLEEVDETRHEIDAELQWQAFREPTNQEVSKIQDKVLQFETISEHRAAVAALPEPSSKRLLPIDGPGPTRLPPVIIPSPPRR